jgi:hypothetical protein
MILDKKLMVSIASRKSWLDHYWWSYGWVTVWWLLRGSGRAAQHDNIIWTATVSLTRTLFLYLLNELPYQLNKNNRRLAAAAFQNQKSELDCLNLRGRLRCTFIGSSEFGTSCVTMSSEFGIRCATGSSEFGTSCTTRSSEFGTICVIKSFEFDTSCVTRSSEFGVSCATRSSEIGMSCATRSSGFGICYVTGAPNLVQIARSEELGTQLGVPNFVYIA